MSVRFIAASMLAIFTLSCGPDQPAVDKVSDILTGDLGAESLSKEFSEANVDFDLDNFQENVRLYLVDAPVDAKSVKVTISEIGIHRTGPEGEWIRVDADNQQFDLMELRDGPSGVLGDITLDPGSYNLLRLKVSEGEITLNNGETHSLCIPENGRKNHVQLRIDLTIDDIVDDESLIDEELNAAADQSDDDFVEVAEDAYGVLVDFDALESIREFHANDADISDSSCTYVLRPVLKLKRAAKLFKAKRKVKRKMKKHRERLKRAKERMNKLKDRSR